MSGHEASHTLDNQVQIPKSSFPSFWHLFSLAIIIFLYANSLVSIQDSAFVLFSVIYIIFLSKSSFPSLSNSPHPRIFDAKNKVLAYYVLFAAVIGMILPLAHILEGIFQGDRQGIEAAAPHLFLVASQVIMEGIAYHGKFSIPISVFVPVFYNSRRIFTLVDWLSSEIYSGSGRRVLFGRGLAVANMSLWCFNLFGFLLPFYLPKAFKVYYSMYNKEDKQKE